MSPADIGFQAAASKQGRGWETVVETWLTFHDWMITGRRVDIDDVEIDLIARDPYGRDWWIESKGSHRGDRPGCTRSDTVKKAVACAYHLMAGGRTTPYALVTSHMPIPGSVGDAMLRRAVHAGAFTWAGVATNAAPTIPVAS